MREAAIRSSYVAVADLYIELFGTKDAVDEQDLRFLERNFQRCDGDILDIGCGPGHLTGYLADLGLAVGGIDLVPEFVDNARMNWPGIDFEVGSMMALDAPDRSLHGILAWYSLIHCHPSDLAEVLAEFRRTLVVGGTLVLGFFDSDRLEPFEHKVTTAYRWPIDLMSSCLSEAGFVEVDRLRRPARGIGPPTCSAVCSGHIGAKAVSCVCAAPRSVA